MSGPWRGREGDDGAVPRAVEHAQSSVKKAFLGVSLSLPWSIRELVGRAETRAPTVQTPSQPQHPFAMLQIPPGDTVTVRSQGNVSSGLGASPDSSVATGKHCVLGELQDRPSADHRMTDRYKKASRVQDSYYQRFPSNGSSVPPEPCDSHSFRGDMGRRVSDTVSHPAPYVQAKHRQDLSHFTDPCTAAQLMNSRCHVAQGLIQLFIEGTTSKRCHKS